MREIKFRAWDTRTKMWVKTVPFAVDRENFITICEAPEWLIPMQYTGLKDKNNKEIYEGDIVKLESSFKPDRPLITDVKWSETGLNWNVWPLFHDRRHWEVIGNIYENPELLKTK